MTTTRDALIAARDWFGFAAQLAKFNGNSVANTYQQVFEMWLKMQAAIDGSVGQDEPVAWQWKVTSDDVWMTTNHKPPATVTGDPNCQWRALYTAPQPASADARDAEFFRWMRDNPDHKRMPRYDSGQWHIPCIVNGRLWSFDTLESAVTFAMQAGGMGGDAHHNRTMGYI